MIESIKTYIESLDVSSIEQERKSKLKQLVDVIQAKQKSNEPIRINFICTHNSRRSHLAQIWAQTMANYYAMNFVSCYSAGTESTALSLNVISALKEVGFRIETLAEGNEQPIYSIKYASNENPIIGFSKTLGHNFNPESGFVAIMTCSEADGGCPFIAGAEKRIPLTYEDPKIADGKPNQNEVYEARSKQIATEMAFVFKEASK